MKIAIINGRVVTPLRLLENAGVMIEDGTITSVGEIDTISEADQVIDVKGCFVSPGFIDMHTHGGGGYDFMDGTADAFIGAALAHMKHGTTSLTPTTLSSSEEELMLAFRCYAEAKVKMKDGPNLLGMHLEGPYFSAEQAGAQDPKYLKTPVKERYTDIFNACGDISRVSAAAELPGALELGDELRHRGIIAAIGHSNALYEDVQKAVERGYSLITHLYSGMSMLRRIGPWRHLGVVESAYMIDELDVEIIADGCHLPPDLLKLILKQKPWDKVCLITDSMRGAGLPDGEIVKLGSLEHGQNVILENGVAMLMDRSAFAGSVCTADRCVRTMVHDAGLPVTDAVRMMTMNPARVLGVKDKGILARGYDADICVFGDDIQIKQVIVGGKIQTI